MSGRIEEGKTGNPPDVLKTLADRRKLEPSGDASLQNSIEMAMGGMGCVYSTFQDGFILTRICAGTFPRILLGRS